MTLDQAPVRVPSFIEAGWDTREHLGGDVCLLHYPDGTRRLEHTCTRPGLPASTIVCAPALSRGHTMSGGLGHATITPSVSCPRCDLHGWVRDGTWEPA